jgi:hypothetical protein
LVTVLYTLFGGLGGGHLDGSVARHCQRRRRVRHHRRFDLASCPAARARRFIWRPSKTNSASAVLHFDLTQNGNFWVMLLYGAFFYICKNTPPTRRWCSAIWWPNPTATR